MSLAALTADLRFLFGFGSCFSSLLLFARLFLLGLDAGSNVLFRILLQHRSLAVFADDGIQCSFARFAIRKGSMSGVVHIWKDRRG